MLCHFFMRLEHPFIWVFTEFLILVPLGYWRMTACRKIKSLSIYIEILLCHIWERERKTETKRNRDNWEQYLFPFILIQSDSFSESWYLCLYISCDIFHISDLSCILPQIILLESQFAFIHCSFTY